MRPPSRNSTPRLEGGLLQYCVRTLSGLGMASSKVMTTGVAVGVRVAVGVAVARPQASSPTSSNRKVVGRASSVCAWKVMRKVMPL